MWDLDLELEKSQKLGVVMMGRGIKGDWAEELFLPPHPLTPHSSGDTRRPHFAPLRKGVHQQQKNVKKLWTFPGGGSPHSIDLGVFPLISQFRPG